MSAVKHAPATPLPWMHGNGFNKSFPYVIADTTYNIGLLRKEGDARYAKHAANAYPKLVEVTRHCARPSNEFDVDAAMLDARELLRSLGEDA